MKARTIAMASPARLDPPMLTLASLSAGRAELERVRATISDRGCVVLQTGAADRRGFESLCRELFDAPMIHGGRRRRTGTSDVVQAVDPGEHPIAPHCEYAYTPFRPDLAAFHCSRAPREGGQTLLIDGVSLLAALAPDQRAALAAQALCHDSEVPAIGWQRMFSLDDPDALATKLDALIEAFVEAGGHEQLRYRLAADGELWFRYQASALIDRRRGQAFATSLGFPPRPGEGPGKRTWLRFADGSVVDPALCRAVLVDHVEALAHAHRWEPGDVLIADNWSVLHGRRAFRGPRDIDACFGYADWLRPPGRACVHAKLA